VDDKWDNRSVLVNLLTPLGFKVSEATNGLECLAKADECQPDLILMDLVMPVMDGFEATRRIRQSSRLKDVVVVALSASTFDHNRQSSIEAGCNDFLPKPVLAEDLFEKLRVHLSLEWVYEQELPMDELKQLPEKSQIAPPPEELAVLFNLAKRGEIVAIRQEIARIEQLGDPFIPFAAELGQLAKGFQMKQMCEFLRPHLEKPNEL
jgi:CheY-like chemotaxis protein